MKFGTVVRFKKDFIQDGITIEKGRALAVAQYSENEFIKLNSFESGEALSELIIVEFKDINDILEVIGSMYFFPLPQYRSYSS